MIRYYSLIGKLSLSRKRESINDCWYCIEKWIPACAGMTNNLLHFLHRTQVILLLVFQDDNLVRNQCLFLVLLQTMVVLNHQTLKIKPKQLAKLVMM